MDQNTTGGTTFPSKRPIYNKVGFFKICAAVLSTLLAALGGILFSASFDAESMYFKSTSTSYIWGVAIAVAVVAAIILVAVSKERITPAKRKAATLLQYLAALVLFFLFIQSIIGKSWWLVVFSLIAIAYFLGLYNKHIVANTILGIGTVIFCGVAIAQTYFDYGIAVNSPYKLLCQFGMAISMLLIVSELRFELDDGKSGAYKLLSCLTFALNLTASVASAALIIGGVDGIHYCFVPCAAMAIYSAKIFFARPVLAAETQPSDIYAEITDEKGTDTDENVN